MILVHSLYSGYLKQQNCNRHYFFPGMGLGFIQNSSFVAINSYFKVKKSRAVGLANVGTGVGQTLMPHLVSYLLENYGYQGACLLLSGLSLHGVTSELWNLMKLLKWKHFDVGNLFQIGGTLLIQPIEWHLKKVEEEVIIDENIHLLQKHKDIVIRKDSMQKNEIYSGLRRSTEPNLNGKGTKTAPLNQFNSHKELAPGNGVKSSENLNGKEFWPQIFHFKLFSKNR